MMFWMNTAEKDGEIKRFCGIGEYAYQLTLKKVEEKRRKNHIHKEGGRIMRIMGFIHVTYEIDGTQETAFILFEKATEFFTYIGKLSGKILKVEVL